MYDKIHYNKKKKEQFLLDKCLLMIAAMVVFIF